MTSRQNGSKKYQRGPKLNSHLGKQYQQGFLTNQMVGPSPKNRALMSKIKTNQKQPKGKKKVQTNNAMTISHNMGDYSSDSRALICTQQSHPTMQNAMMMHSEGNSSTKLLLNNLTGMTTSGYMFNQMGHQQPASHRDDKAGTGTTIFTMPPGPVDHDGCDPYMSFIDSDKFSPIQSVSGEEIDEDDSLGH